MKKFLKVLIIAMVLLLPVTFASAKKAKTTTTEETVGTNGTPVNLYVFYGSTCSHCADLHTFLSELKTDSNYNYMFEVVDYEVWSDSTNATLMQNVATKLGISVGGVPFYVVGDFYGNNGFPNPTSNAEMYATATKELKDAIKKAYTEANKKNGSYVDIVASVGTGNTTVKDEATTKTGNDIVGYILLGITIIIVVCIVFGRSSTKEDFEEVEEPVVEEVKEVEEKKAPAKKAEAKKTTTAKKTTAKKTTTKKSTTKKTTTKKNK